MSRPDQQSLPPKNSTLAASSSVCLRDWLFALILGALLAGFVWKDLLSGGSLIGGDTFPYFMPQKVVIAEAFEAGELPLWHPYTGLGYPLHAESQGGIFYPTTQTLYRLFDVVTAYNLTVVLHYWLAFVFAWRFARCQGLANAGAFFASLVFVYGWFPVRVSLEWSIIGGLWLPLTLWLTDRAIQKTSVRRLAVLTLCLAVHLLAGHFTLAFINHLAIAAYALWMCGRKHSGEPRRWKSLAAILLACGLAFPAAAIQVLPTYELKQTSQREGENRAFNPAYGHMPPVYASQVVGSWWYWHTLQEKGSPTFQNFPATYPANTNHVEAHLYWGLIPFALLVLLCVPQLRGRLGGVHVGFWLLLILGSAFYATGWLMPVTQHLPGFSFFMGPGRYTILASLGGAILSGAVLDAWLRDRTVSVKFVMFALLGGVTLFDLQMSSNAMRDAITLPFSPMENRSNSWVRQTLAPQASSTRLLAAGPNVGNLFGVSCVPQYLGIGPAIYYSDKLQLPTGPDSADELFPSDELAEKLRAWGLTHVFTTEPIANPSPDLELPGALPDALLGSVWGHRNSVYLYALKEPGQRVVAEPQAALQSWAITSRTPSTVEVKVSLSQPADVALRELMYPGWVVCVDDREAAAIASPSFPEQRIVNVAAGEHVLRWEFQPRSVQLGMWISGISLCLLLLAISLGLRELTGKPESTV